MKIKHLLSLILVALVSLSSQAQTAEEIIAKYFENIGGYTNWAKVDGIKMTGKGLQGGMEFPMLSLSMKDGRQLSSFTVQGKEIKQNVYDGTTLWSTNFNTMKAEKSDAESTDNHKANLGGDFPMPFFDYKKFGYKVELLGKETIDGTEAYKIKLTKNPTKVDGKSTESIELYYFDLDNGVPIMMESEMTSGPAKGMTIQVRMSDYQEVNGLLYPFTISQGAKGQGVMFTMKLSAVEINPKVDASLFAMPAN
jgi:outer membrane lipoprotein-sorting protein